MADRKMTYAVAIDNAINGNITDEVVERLNDLKAQLAKRGSGHKGPTKTQKENEVFKNQILENLRAEVDGMTATEIGDALGFSCHKATALLTPMVKAKVVRREKVGKVVRFFAVN